MGKPMSLITSSNSWYPARISIAFMILMVLIKCSNRKSCTSSRFCSLSFRYANTLSSNMLNFGGSSLLSRSASVCSSVCRHASFHNCKNALILTKYTNGKLTIPVLRSSMSTDPESVFNSISSLYSALNFITSTISTLKLFISTCINTAQ